MHEGGTVQGAATEQHSIGNDVKVNVVRVEQKLAHTCILYSEFILWRAMKVAKKLSVDIGESLAI